MNPSPQEKILAQAVYEIRLLLGGYLGSEAEGHIAVRQAAHLAYALHNEAEAVVSGRSFDVDRALSKVAAVDAMLGSTFNESFSQAGINRVA